MQVFSRRRLIGVGAIAGFLALLEYLRRQGEPPPEAWVRESLWGDDLVAYAVWNDIPRAALLVRDKRLAYDLMIPGDWIWPNWPPRPQWQLAGMGYSIAASDAPATVGYAKCVGIAGERCTQAPELFGQINDLLIATMEVKIGDTWRQFPVSAPRLRHPPRWSDEPTRGLPLAGLRWTHRARAHRILANQTWLPSLATTTTTQM